MLDVLDRYSLALAVLNRDDDTRVVLADALEESGERALARWARKGKGSSRKRLDFVLAVVPHTTAVLLVCDFVEHLGPKRIPRGSADIIEQVRNAVRREKVQSMWLSEAREQANRLPRLRSVAWTSDMQFAHECLMKVIESGQQALLAAWHREQGNSKDSHSFAQKAQAEARRTTKATHHFNTNELAWQIEYTKQFLEKLWPK